MKRFTVERLFEIVGWLRTEVEKRSVGDSLYFEAPDPDLGAGRYAGEAAEEFRHRGYGAWLELAESFGCRLLTPRFVEGKPGMLQLGFQKLDPGLSFHDAAPGGDETDVREKYGAQSEFSRISKLENPAFLLTFIEAIDRVGVRKGASVLNLGINTGDEFQLLKHSLGSERFSGLTLLGIDHCRSAIDTARQRFPGPRHRFECIDINELGRVNLPRFDLIMSVGTLHSPGIKDSKQLLMDLVQNHLEPEGSVILGFPNCRWFDGEVLYGARTKNYREPELSLLFKDVDFAKRYLLQHKFRVTITGKTYVCLTAKPNRSQASPRKQEK